jgi:hypothetical protein
MNVKFSLTCAVVFAVGTLLFSGNAFGQFAGEVKVSNVIEGGTGGVSTARCGSNIVVGFGDVESGKPNSFDGFAYSQNGGGTFTDGGTLPVPPEGPLASGPNSLGAVGRGNPSVACSSPSHFYYASFYSSTDPICFFPACPAISVSASADGGKTWGLPVVVATNTADTHDLLSPSLAVDPTDLSRLFVAYIDDNFSPPFDFDFNDCQGAFLLMDVMELRLGISTDGGKTWTTSFVDHACDSSTNPDHQGVLSTPNVVVSPGGKVYLTYEFLSSSPLPNEIRFTRSLDQGKTFTTAISVSKDAINNALPQVAVDRTTSTHRGEIYLTWSGTPTGTYTDVLVSDSVNFGLSFSFPRPISPAPAAGSGRFQTNPVIAVDNDGQVVDCFHSTPSNVPTGTSVYSYNCATSFNHAASWTAQRLATFAPVGLDAVTSDFLLHTDGFFTAFELTSAGQRHVVSEKSDLI